MQRRANLLSSPELAETGHRGASRFGRGAGRGVSARGFSWSGATAPRFDEAAQQRRARGFFFLRRKMGEGGELPGFAPRPPPMACLETYTPLTGGGGHAAEGRKRVGSEATGAPGRAVEAFGFVYAREACGVFLLRGHGVPCPYCGRSPAGMLRMSWARGVRGASRNFLQS